MTIMNESLGELSYDGLINAAIPADTIHAAVASGYGILLRGTLIAKNTSGALIPWGSDITDDLSEVLSTSNHVATKAQAGLRSALLKVFAAEFLNETAAPDDEHKVEIHASGLDADELVVKAKKRYIEATLEVTDHVATDAVTGLDVSTVVVINGEEELAKDEDYTLTYESNTLAITLLEASSHYNATTLSIAADYTAYDTLTATTHYAATYEDGVLTITLEDSTDWTNTSSVKVYCEYEEDVFVLVTLTQDYTAAYAANTMTITFKTESDFYDTPKVKIVCPYTYNEATIAGANLVLAKDVDTGTASGQTVVAEAYRTGVFTKGKLLYDAKAIDGINDVTKENLRNVGILINDAA